jgi:hypothetical protein
VEMDVLGVAQPRSRAEGSIEPLAAYTAGGSVRPAVVGSSLTWLSRGLPSTGFCNPVDDIVNAMWWLMMIPVIAVAVVGIAALIVGIVLAKRF